jgi:coenzyme F420-reducing hydrogenase delta subunit
MCSGRVDPGFILQSFASGADGVMVLGCPLGECHYKEGNFHALKRQALLRRVLEQLGIDPVRLRTDWISAGDSDSYVKAVSDMVQEIHRLGPLDYGG